MSGEALFDFADSCGHDRNAQSRAGFEMKKQAFPMQEAWSGGYRVQSGSMMLLGILLVGLLAPAAHGQKSDKLDIARRALELLRNRCDSCHVSHAELPEFSRDRQSLLLPSTSGDPFVTPKNLEKSEIWQRVKSGQMPRKGDGRPPLTDSEKSLLKSWIDEGAEFPPGGTARPFMSRDIMLQAIGAHLSTHPLDRPFLRYFSITHLHNNPNVDEARLRLTRAALVKALNFLSRNSQIVQPDPVDPARTIYAVDIRTGGWQAGDWACLDQSYPYALVPHDRQESAHYNDITKMIGAGTFTGIPYYRADWFVATATRAPFYDSLVGLPKTLAELEQQLGANIQREFDQQSFTRAALLDSGVSAQNRVIDAYSATNRSGYVWVTYDFKSSTKGANITRLPLGPDFKGNPFRGDAKRKSLVFQHDAGEVIFRLPNGLHGYMLVDAAGKRLDGPGLVEIVRDPNESSGTPQVVNSISCIGCHKLGLRDDFIRAGSAGKSLTPEALALPDPAVRDFANVVFDQTQFKKRLDEEQHQFLATLSQVLKPFLYEEQADLAHFPEPVTEVARFYYRNISPEDAEAELGMDPRKGNGQLNGRSLRDDFGLGPLQLNRPIKRSVWDALGPAGSTFQEVASELDIGHRLDTHPR